MTRDKTVRQPSRTKCRAFLVVTALLLVGSAWRIAGTGTAPLLRFDVPFLVGCRTLPLKDGPAQGEPGQDLIEVVIPISVRVLAGTERDLKQCLYTLTDPVEPETLLVRDWLPRTELRTEYAKPIHMSKEGMAKVGISLSAHYVVAAAGDAGGQVKSGVTYEMLPPQEIVLASGTTHHGHGIFFKLKPSTQTTLEGMKAFSAIFAVPRGWRAGYVKLDCEALGQERGMVRQLDQEVNSGRAVFYMALYMTGDSEAETLAGHMARCEHDLLDAFAQQRLDAKVPSRKFFTWPGTLDWQPWLSKKSSTPTEITLTSAQLVLLARGLQPGATPATALEEYPWPVREKFLALQEAAENLSSLSARHPRARDPAAARPRQAGTSDGASSATSAKKTGANVITSFAELRVGRERTVPDPNASLATAPARHDLDHPLGGPNLGREPVGVSREEQRGIRAGTAPVPPVKADAEPPKSAGDGKSDGPRPMPTEPVGAVPLPPVLPRQAWYLLASIWGALFAYIVAPLVVDSIRRRMKTRHRHSSKRKQAILMRTMSWQQGVQTHDPYATRMRLSARHPAGINPAARPE